MLTYENLHMKLHGRMFKRHFSNIMTGALLYAGISVLIDANFKILLRPIVINNNGVYTYL
jgi:hypothetical protein